MSRAATARSSQSRGKNNGSRSTTQQQQQQQLVDVEVGASTNPLDTPDFEPIEKLSELAIGASEIKKLRESGIYAVSSVLMHTRKALTQVKGLSEAKVDKIREAALKLAGAGFITGTEARVRRNSVVHITSGSSALDSLLGGGIESGSITEIFGEFRTGKTQISHTLCVTAQLPYESGGGNGRVAYIDTENGFRPERIIEIANRYELDPDDVLDNILVARAYTSEHQIELLNQVAARMASDQFALLIVDSATALFRVDFSGRGELSERQQKLNRFLSSLTKLAECYNACVLITNQVMATPDSSAMFVSDPKKPIGGHVMAHASTTRLSLRKGRGDQRICKVYDSPMYAEAEATYQIGAQGICDPDD